LLKIFVLHFWTILKTLFWVPKASTFIICIF
jgi:hypothetical protein